MSDLAGQAILHNYPQSPVAEKVRVALGIKGLDWHNVEIPRLPPKPMLTTLTGGYRRTPVMQIGADIYCDSQCIIRELENRFPSPPLLPEADAGLLWCLSRWTDGALFELAVKIVLGSAGDALPQDFAQDRGRLYMGENWQLELKRANSELPHLIAQLRAPLTWLEQLLSDNRAFIMGAAPSAIDAQMYHVLWFIQGRWSNGPLLLEQFPLISQWMQNILAIGHGTQHAMSADTAIDIARSSQSSTVEGITENEPQQLEIGQRVSISPDVNGGEQAVEGVVRFASAETIAIDRISDEAGNVCVHFPRSGYLVEPH